MTIQNFCAMLIGTVNMIKVQNNTQRASWFSCEDHTIKSSKLGVQLLILNFYELHCWMVKEPSWT